MLGTHNALQINPRPALRLTNEASSTIIILGHPRYRSGMISLKRSAKKTISCKKSTLITMNSKMNSIS